MSLESNKTLGGIGALLVAIGSFVPFLGIVGIILVLVAMKGLAEYYNDHGIFQNALYAFLFGIIGLIAAAVVLISIFFGGFFGGMMLGPEAAVGGGFLSLLLGIIVALVVVFVFYLLTAIFYRKSFNTLAEKTGEKMFETAGTLMLIGAILTIIIIGLIFVLIAWILVAVAFFSMKTGAPPQAPPPPPPPQ